MRSPRDTGEHRRWGDLKETFKTMGLLNRKVYPAIKREEEGEECDGRSDTYGKGH